jgi:hypothetical protein
MQPSDDNAKSGRDLNLKAGEWVEVRSREEILATLDERGSLEAMPFMPEMLKYCGQRLRVHKSAHKTCDTIEFKGARKLKRAVHLANTRCDGAFHGGCQASCMFFWKDAWLKRVDSGPATQPRDTSASVRVEQTLLAATRADGGGAVERFSCQATELNRASEELSWWDARQYVKDVWSRNIPISRILSALAFRIYEKLMRLGAWRLLLRTYDGFQRLRGGIPFPFKMGSRKQTPVATLGLRPGERVEVKSQDEILQTVNERNRNRGLSFDEEMVEFCGRTYNVLKRVERIINERTGEMMTLKGDCIILDGATCNSRFKDKRLFCPRSIYPYWREIWLRRVDSAGGAPPVPGEARK